MCDYVSAKFSFLFFLNLQYFPTFVTFWIILDTEYNNLQVSLGFAE